MCSKTPKSFWQRDAAHARCQFSTECSTPAQSIANGLLVGMGWSRNAMMGTLPSLLNPSENEAIDCSAGFPKDTVGKRILQNDTTRTWPALQDAVTNRRSSRSAAGGLLLLYALPPLRSAMTGRVFRFGKSFQSVDFKVQFACKCMQIGTKRPRAGPAWTTIADGGGVSRDFGNWKLAMARQ